VSEGRRLQYCLAIDMGGGNAMILVGVSMSSWTAGSIFFG
jgi:hypothetical protein